MIVEGYTCFRGRVGLSGILKSLGIRRGDEVITQAFTCVAVPEGIIAGGGTPVFVDLSEGSVNMDPEQLEMALGRRTKAIIVQHTFGYAGPVRDALELAKGRGIAVIEDCCHTIQTTLGGKKVGQFGDAAFYSLEWGKPLPCGVGGVVTTNRPDLREKLAAWHDSLQRPSAIRALRLELQYAAFSMLYRPRTYWPVKAAFSVLARTGAAEGNFSDLRADRISSDFGLQICASVDRRFRRKLSMIDDIAGHSRAVVEEYRKIPLADGISRVAEDDSDGAVLARYPLWSRSKTDLLDAARRANVELADWYRTPVDPLTGLGLRAFNYHEGSCPNAEIACKNIVSLPTNLGVDGRFIAKASALLSDKS